MNKKLLAAAVTAAMFAAPAAFAESTMYGKLHVTTDYQDAMGGGNQNYAVNSRASRLGFKGSEDLGDGLKAIFQIELTVNADGGNQQNVGNGFGGQRNTFVGLAGDWGTFVVGRHDTPAKMAFYASGNEVLGDSIIDLNSGTLGVFSELRANNAIAYVSPSFSGFTLSAAVVPGEETGAGDTADGIADHMSFGAMYKGGGLKASVGYEELNAQDGGVNSPDSEMWQAGATYAFGNFQVGGEYQSTDDFGNVTGAEYTAWALTGKATFGNNALMLVYTDSETENAAGVTTSDTDGWGLAAEHNFSKRTKVYVAYATEDDDKVVDGTAHTVSLGMIHDF